MSLSVVSACMLAAITARQFREECRDAVKNWEKMTATDVLKKALDKNVLKKCAIKAKECMDIDSAFEPPNDGACALATFKDLAGMSKEAYSSSVLCTCEGSGRIANPDNGRFIRCSSCGASLCGNCTKHYNLNGHDNVDINWEADFSASGRCDPADFSSLFLQRLPSQLYLPKEAIAEMISLSGDDDDEDIWGVAGLENFVFALDHTKRTRFSWNALYSAKMNGGVGHTVAQLVVKVGALERGRKLSSPSSFGASAFLYCYQPTLDRGVRGRVRECLRLFFPMNADTSDVHWEVRKKKVAVSCKLVGSEAEDSTRIKMGVLPEAASSIKRTSQDKARKRDINENRLAGTRRWYYVKGWQEFPKKISVTGLTPDINGVYVKEGCERTIPHSALWKRQRSENEDASEADISSNTSRERYILIKPNVSRNAADRGIISSSPSVTDNASIKVVLSTTWQPSDPLIEEFQDVKNCERIDWAKTSKKFSVVVPKASIRVQPAPYIEDPKPSELPEVLTVTGLDDNALNMLTAHSSGYASSSSSAGDDTVELNLFDGVKGMKTARCFTSLFSAALMKQGSETEDGAALAYALDDKADGWRRLTPRERKFGHDEAILVKRPSEK